MKNQLLALLAVGILATACKKESELTPAPTASFDKGVMLAERNTTTGGVTTSDIVSISPDGTLKNLTNNPAGKTASRAHKAFNADKITFYSNRDGTEDIYSMNPDGSGLRRLTNDATRDFNSSFSPDGSKVVWTCFRTNPNGDIWLMDADGSNAKNLTPTNDRNRSPYFSPDGKTITFHRSVNGQTQIMTMQADGSGLKQITNGNHPFFAYNPVWSFDGQFILFNTERDGTVDIYYMKPDGTGQTAIRRNIGHSFMVWAPDGNRIAFNADRPATGNFRQIYVGLKADDPAQPPVKVKPLSVSETDYVGINWWY